MSDHYGNISIADGDKKEKENSIQKTRSRRKSRKKSSQRQRPLQSESSSGGFILAAIIGLLILVIYSAAGFWGVPKFLGSWLPEKVRSKTQLVLDISEIRFNPFSFNLDFGETSLFEPDSTIPLLSFTSVAVELKPVSLLRGDFVTETLDIENLVLNVVREKSTEYNFHPIIQSLRQSKHSDIMDFSELPFLFSLNNISLSDSRINFKDLPNSSIHIANDIQLQLPNISNFPYRTKRYIQPRFSAIINDSPIELTSQSGLFTDRDGTNQQKTNLSCEINDIDLSLYFGYLPTHLPFNITEGKADGMVQLTFSPDATEKKFLAEFSLNVSGLKLSDENDNYHLDIPASKFEGGVQPFTGDTYLHQVSLIDSKVRVKKGKLLELSRMLSAQKSTDELDPLLPAPLPPRLVIDLLVADGGTYTSYDPVTGKDIDIWESVQFSLKKYSNRREEQNNTPAPVFRIYGEKSKSHTVLSWSGNIDPENKPAGKFRLDNIKTGLLFDWLGVESLTTATGLADLAGSLTLIEPDKPGTPLDVSLKDGSIVFHDLTLNNEDEIWYSAPITKVDNFSKIGRRVNLGNLQLKNSIINLKSDSLPPLFLNVRSEKSSVTFQSVDYTGALNIESAEKKRSPLNFEKVSLKFLRIRPEAKNPPPNLSLKADLKSGGQLQANGKLALIPFKAALTTSFNDLECSTILPWLGKGLFFKETSGKLQGQGTLNYPHVIYKGDLGISNGSFGSTDQSAVTWKQFTLNDFRISNKPYSLEGETVIFESPRTSLIRDPDSDHPAGQLISFFSKNLGGISATGKKDTSRTIDIKQLLVKDGTITYLDNRLEPSWESEAGYFRGALNNIRFKNGKSTPAPFSFSGNLDTVPFTMEGSINLFDPQAAGDYQLNMKGFPFPAFHDQLQNRIDLDTGKGQLSLTKICNWNNGVLTEQDRIVLEDVDSLSTESDMALTLGLLTGNNNTFDLQLSSRHSLSEPGEPLLAKTVTALKKLIIKASVSPYLVATGDFSDIAGNEFVQFEPGGITLSGQGRESLTRFSSLLSAHPSLGIIITGGADTDIDGYAMKRMLEQAELKRVTTENEKRKADYDMIRREYDQQVEAAWDNPSNDSVIAEQEIPEEIFLPFVPLEPEPVVVDDKMLRELAGDRAMVIVNFFTDRLAVDPQRIEVADQSLTGQSSSEGANRVLFELKPYAAQKKFEDIPPPTPER